MAYFINTTGWVVDINDVVAMTKRKRSSDTKNPYDMLFMTSSGKELDCIGAGIMKVKRCLDDETKVQLDDVGDSFNCQEDWGDNLKRFIKYKELSKHDSYNL